MVQIKLVGHDNITKSLGLFSRKIPKVLKETANEELEELQRRMKIKTSKFKFSTDGTSVHDSFKITKATGTKDITASLRNIAPHAAFLEHGVKPHYVAIKRLRYKAHYPGQSVAKAPLIDSIDKLRKWSDKTFKERPRVIYVGGPGSSIQKGASQRQFFFNTIDEYTRSEKREQLLSKAAKKILKK